MSAAAESPRTHDGPVAVGSTDLFATVVELQMQEVAYEAARAVTARPVQPSLLDFLR